MKLNQNNKQERIIGTDDIFISSNNSSLGNNLESLLLKQDQDIIDLKRNVKWLYKYGGVGGSGGGGGTGGTSDTKISCTITYTDINGQQAQRKIGNGSYYNIQEGTPITVTCTIISNKSLNEYLFTVNNLKTTIKATDANGSITTTPGGNTVYTVTLAGESTVSLSFTVFTKVTELTHEIVLPDGITIQSNSSIYESQIEGANYVFTFINNQPNSFESAVTGVSINSKVLTPSEYTIEEKFNSLVNSKTIVLTVPLSTQFTVYDIYNVSVKYNFGLDELTQTDQFIYQSENAFVYCWSDTIGIYNKEVSEPKISNNYNNVVNYRIYPARADSLTQKYNLQIEVNGKVVNLVAQAGTQYTYTVVNEVKDDSTQKISVKFTLDGEYYTYYMFLQKAQDVTYFFETDSGRKYYQAISCDSENLNENIITFPSKNPTIEGNPIVISTQLETPIKLASSNFGTLSNDDLVSNFVQSQGQDRGTLRLDALFSFGIKYVGSNWDLPIIGIKNTDNTGTKLLTLYKNTLSYNNTSYDICIPNDGKYHLVQLYFKSDYATSNPSGTININNTKQVVVLYIDGVQETKPFEINSFFIQAKYTSLVYYPGLWQFNHIGVATFNGIPSSAITGIKQACVAKYLLDFDPIIPSNYYQTYKTRVLGEELTEKFDKTIYDSLSINTSSKNGDVQWINYFNYNKDTESHLNKFINVSPSVIASLAPSDMEIYCIVPESTNLGLQESGFDPVPDKHLNQFLYNTFKSYGESDLVSKVSCSFQKWKTDKWVDVISNSEDSDSPIQFYVKYQGSSTLLYSAKNFEVGVNPILNQDSEELPVYFTPDVDLFPYMESSFNLKADIVDSSHSNNVVIGNFVNDYMTSPFNTTKKNYKSCLTGKPILLFIQNNAVDPSDNKTILDDSYIFLGIYSLNLNRSSVHNLGYSQLLDSAGNEIVTTANTVTDERCCDSITKFHILQQTEKEDFSNDFAVAEVQDNGILYDYSQFDSSLLANQVLGDFYVSDNDRISKEYSSVFTKPFSALAKVIYNYMIKSGIFHTTNLEEAFKDSRALQNPQNYYYTNSSGQLVNLPQDCITVDSNDINELTKGVPYHEYETVGNNKVALINNPLQQFHLICDSSGTPINNQKTTYYYLETLSNLIYDQENPDARIDVESAVKYFITCMAFAMVDSVQKNLTIKCPDTKNNNIWYLAFYDMDTGFGISNSGGTTSFQAFSDYVDSDGLIIQDYSPLHSSTLFDTPSSFLFLYAKYIDIITNNGMSETTNGIYPFLEWSKLRETGGAFESGDKFCAKYIDNYFGDINPLIWNLNYSYKYFSESKNSSISDNESGRFNGTRRFARKEYLNQRFQYLDVLFGFRNAKTIGLSSNFLITNGSLSIPNNDDIKINNTMFPAFKKGVSGNINVEVQEQPKTPIVLQVSTSISQLYITDSKGRATVNGNITSNTDCGFYGTSELTSVSECGQFLKNTSTSNSITNQRLKNINISSSLSSKDSSLELDLANLLSAETIVIGGSSRLYYNTITIKNTSQSSVILTSLTLNNIQCNSIVLSNFDVSGKLTINNCSANTLQIDTITADQFIHTNNSFLSESWQVLNTTQILNITNQSCVSLAIENSEIKSLTYTPSYNLSNLTVNSCTIDSFALNYSHAFETITVKNVDINTFKLNSNYSAQDSNVPIAGTLNLGFVNSYVNLSIPGLDNITELTLGNVTSCNLLDNAFSDCRKLQSLPSNVKFTIRGNKVFRRANSMNQEDMLRCILPDDTNYWGLFLFNQSVDTTFVQKWFQQKTANSLNYLFCGCPNITLQYDAIGGRPSDAFYDFEEAFVDSVNRSVNVQQNWVGTFYLSNVNILTKDMTDALTEKGVKTYESILGSNSSNTDQFGSIMFIERLALNKFSSVKLTGTVIENTWKYRPVSVFDGEGILRDSRISDYFDDSCQIQSLYEFNPIMYNSGDNSYGIEISLDFSDGFPASMKNISMFRYISNVNVLNMERAFDKVSGCTLTAGSFHNTQCTSDKSYDQYTDLFEMFFKEEDGNITPKVSISFEKDDADGTYMSFPKKISQERFLKILEYYTEKVTNLSWLFRGTTVYNCTDNHILDYKLTPFTTLLYTFSYCTFKGAQDEDLHIDIQKAFAVEGSSKTTEINSLKHTFEGCQLTKFTDRLPIRNVKNMNSTFANCTFVQDSALSQPISVWQPSGIYSIQPYTDKEFQILPDNFFAICSSGCDLTSCFKCSGFSVTNLTGYLPNLDTLGLQTVFNRGAIMNNLFRNCNITFYPMQEEGKYRIFPSWYTQLVFTNKYNVYIPFTTLVDGDRIYLFESASKILGNYNTLPNMPNIQSGSSYYYSRVTGNNANQNCQLKVAPDEDTFPTISGTDTYKNMIPYRLSLILRFISPTQVITNMKNLIEQGNTVIINSKPLVTNLEDGNKSVIFNGDTIDENVKNYVLPN